jgi:DNA excision repair protein ERCC-1
MDSLPFPQKKKETKEMNLFQPKDVVEKAHEPLTSFQLAFSDVLADPEYKKRHENLVNLLKEQESSIPLSTSSTTIPITSLSTNSTNIPTNSTTSNRSSAIIVNKVQKGNPVLDQIRNIPWEFGDTLVDYQVGQTSAVLYLSLKYHRLHPDYIITRLNRIKDRFHLRIMLVNVDIDDHQSTLREVHQISFKHNITIMLAWSVQEAARYLETYKAYEFKPPDLIRAPKETGGDIYMNRLTEALTQIKSVNKTDVVTLATNVGSFKDICHADQDMFRLLNGFGESKAKRLYEAFRQPFKIDRAQRAKRN